jgi:hypothetical protein
MSGGEQVVKDIKNLGPTLDEVMAELTPASRRAVNARETELIAEERSLGELRKALNLTQVAVARRLGKGQETVSRIEQRGDLLLSTLSGYVASLGGELELVCRFKNRAAVRISTGQFVAATSSKAAVRRKARVLTSE